MSFKNITINNGVLSFSFNGKEYTGDDSLITPFDFIETEYENVIALTNSGICKIFKKEGISIDATLVEGVVKVSVKHPDGRNVDVLMDRNSNSPHQGRNNSTECTQDVAENKAFRKLFGVPSTRINVANGMFVPSGKPDKVSDTRNNTGTTETPTSTAPASNVSNQPPAVQNTPSTTSPEEVVINFGNRKGRKVYDILRNDEDGIKYFSTLLEKNAVAQGNANFRNAYLTFFKENPPANEEAKNCFEKTCAVLKQNGLL